MKNIQLTEGEEVAVVMACTIYRQKLRKWLTQEKNEWHFSKNLCEHDIDKITSALCKLNQMEINL